MMTKSRRFWAWFLQKKRKAREVSKSEILSLRSPIISEPELEDGMIQLRGGFTTTDKRLDRLVHFDVKSKNYPITATMQSKKPRSYSWRCNQHLDQGDEGACAGFDVVHELIARPAEVKGLGYAYAYELYRAAQRIDPWEGEDYEGTALIAAVESARRLGWFDGYYWAFGIQDLILGVGMKGPACLGVSWYEGMMDTDADGFVHVTGRWMGGHAILCKGINVKEEYFVLHNSWGTSWGNNGDCKISFDDMKLLLDDDGEAVFLIGRHTKGE